MWLLLCVRFSIYKTRVLDLILPYNSCRSDTVTENDFRNRTIGRMDVCILLSSLSDT
jgi:hypothetical protein